MTEQWRPVDGSIAKDSAAPLIEGQPVVPGVENTSDHSELQQLRASLQQVVEEMLRQADEYDAQAMFGGGGVALALASEVRRCANMLAALSLLPDDGQEPKNDPRAILPTESAS